MRSGTHKLMPASACVRGKIVSELSATAINGKSSMPTQTFSSFRGLLRRQPALSCAWDGSRARARSTILFERGYETSSQSEGPGDSMKLQRSCADASEGPSRNIAWHMSD